MYMYNFNCKNQLTTHLTKQIKLKDPTIDN